MLFSLYKNVQCGKGWGQKNSINTWFNWADSCNTLVNWSCTCCQTSALNVAHSLPLFSPCTKNRTETTTSSPNIIRHASVKLQAPSPSEQFQELIWKCANIWTGSFNFRWQSTSSGPKQEPAFFFLHLQNSLEEKLTNDKFVTNFRNWEGKCS